MAGPEIAPRTYQQVKANLRWYMTFVGGVVAIAIYVFLVPSSQREGGERLLHKYTSVPIAKFITGTSVVAVLTFLCWLAVFIFEIHDKVYDRYVIKWRHSYDLDFILPTLTRPFASHLDPRFFHTAANNMYEFMKPYYEFVGDGERENPITPNLLVRFYEVVTKYWITQINEVLLIVAFIVTFAYFFVYRHLRLPVDTVAIWSLSLPIVFFLNRIAASRSRVSVRQATLDEIEDIQHRYAARLEEAFKNVHSKFDLQWKP